MVYFGRVTKIDRKNQCGEIVEQRGRVFFFSAKECENGILPPAYSTVSFVRDREYISTPVAQLIKVDQFPVGIDSVLSQVDE